MARAGGGSSPLFSLDQNEFEAALAADHLNVEDTARKVSRSSVDSLIAAIVEAEKVLVAGTDQMAFFARSPTDTTEYLPPLAESRS